MLPRGSNADQIPPQQPQKRKSEEYQDPDYANAINHFLTTTKRACFVNDQSVPNTSNNNLQPEADVIKSDEHSGKYRRVCNVIEREFQREINFKLEQLEEIDERLDKAFHLLDRLRYAIVADYYRKQTIPLDASDCSTVRGTQTLFEDEPFGPQLALHPSLKKIIGKKPKTYEEILRTCPTRAAAQNAKQTILIKSQTTKKRERLLQQLIREEGIVIDHSKLSSLEPSIDPLSALNIAEQQAAVKRANGLTSKTAPNKVRMPAAPAKSLNATRLNNKAKHLIVVGNTSKYIGADVDEQDQKSTNKTLSHKWLIYVQAKDPTTPLELYVKKVRFFLHNSYRPNNIIDVCSAPFQIARRGWGEFPIRIQLFFNETLQQKPVQLIHNLILDKTLSGLQTLGAETLVEIWLRSDILELSKPASTSVIQENIEATTTCEQTSSERNRKISYTQIKEIDDNLFEFLNQIEETPTSLCADIEKIQPTVIVTDPVNNISNTTCSLQSNSKIVAKTLKKNFISNANSCSTTNSFTDPSKPESNCAAEFEIPAKQHSVAPIQPDTMSLEIINVKKTDAEPKITVCANNIKIFSNKKTMFVNNGKIIFPENVNRANVQNAYTGKPISSNQPQLVHSFVPKKVLQKKLVQLVDANGNIKYMQMLVATSTVPRAKTTSIASKATASIGGINSNIEESGKISSAPTVVTPLVVRNSTIKINNANTMSLTYNVAEKKNLSSTVSSTMSNSKMLPSALPSNSSSQLLSSNQYRNVVFQKGGKVYIIDPVQMKLKQEQKKQVSLLKPQVSLLKHQLKQQQEQQITPIVCDHDYVPAPAISNVKDSICNTTTKNALTKTATTNYPCVIKSTPFQAEPLRPRLHLGIKHARDSANNALELLHKKRLDFKKDFLEKKFAGVREAVEYLLRRLPLVAEQNYTNLSAVFPFTSKSLEHFNSLPAFKQRACEWLRAKFIANNLKAHSGLYEGDDIMNVLWTTKEVAMFARYHAYTPVIKSLKLITDKNSKAFTELVKIELKNEHQVHFETITSNINICNWISSISKNIENEHVVENQLIDVVSIDLNAENADTKWKTNNSPTKFSNTNEIVYLSSPEYLENETKLVSDICKRININLQTEEIIDGVIHPMSQTLLARCLRLFVEKLLRYTLALKIHRNQSDVAMTNNLINLIEPHEIGKVITTVVGLDFLSNRHLGTIKSSEEISETN